MPAGRHFAGLMRQFDYVMLWQLYLIHLAPWPALLILPLPSGVVTQHLWFSVFVRLMLESAHHFLLEIHYWLLPVQDELRQALVLAYLAGQFHPDLQ